MALTPSISHSWARPLPLRLALVISALSATACEGGGEPDPSTDTSDIADTLSGDTAVDDTAAPDTVVPDTTVPDTTVPDTTAPDTSPPNPCAPNPCLNGSSVV